MTRPSSTTRPIASGQVMPLRDAIENATTAFKPRPAASAIGNLATTPIRIVMTPATSAVAAATRGMDRFASPPMKPPLLSATVPMMSGLSTTM